MDGWPFVEIVWHDITGTSEWTSIAKLPVLTPIVHRGWLIAEDEKTVTICACYCDPDDDDDDDVTVGDVTTIPKSVIQGRIRKLNV